jgi:hypothetical protein
MRMRIAATVAASVVGAPPASKYVKTSRSTPLMTGCAPPPASRRRTVSPGRKR